MAERRTALIAAAAVVAVVAAGVYAARTQPEPTLVDGVTGVFSLDRDPVVRVAKGRWTYATTLRMTGAQAVTVEELTPVAVGARAVERAFVRVAGEPDPASSDGRYAPTHLVRDVAPGEAVEIVLVGRPDCAAPDRVIGIRVAVRTRGFGEETFLVAPPRAADPDDELHRLGERACAA